MAPPFPAETPPVGQVVNVTLSNGVTLPAYHDGAQWWAGLNDNPADVPIDNDHVATWETIA